MQCVLRVAFRKKRCFCEDEWKICNIFCILDIYCIIPIHFLNAFLSWCKNFPYRSAGPVKLLYQSPESRFSNSSSRRVSYY